MVQCCAPTVAATVTATPILAQLPLHSLAAAPFALQAQPFSLASATAAPATTYVYNYPIGAETLLST